MLAALASPTPENPVLEKPSSESDLGDDVVTLSYERALRAHARYQPADRSDWPVAAAGRIGGVIAEDAEALPAAARVVGLHEQTSKVLRGDCDLRCASVTVRLSKAECARLHKHAAEAGVTVSAYLRSCTFEAEALRTQVKEALAGLRATASNENPAAPAKEWRTFGRWVAFGWLAWFLPRRHSASRV